MQPFGLVSLALGAAALLVVAMQTPAMAGTAASLADGKQIRSNAQVDRATEVDYRGGKRRYHGPKRKYRGGPGYRGPKGYRKYPRYRGYRGYRGGPRIGFGFYYGPRILVPPPVIYAPRPPVRFAPPRYGNRCGYWQARCSANWNRYSDIKGCLRYHGCY